MEIKLDVSSVEFDRGFARLIVLIPDAVEVAAVLS